MTFLKLKNIISPYMKKEDVEEIKNAYKLAEEKHRGQIRKSGEEYIIHPLSAAVTLAEMRLDRETIIAALLHDVPEDTGTSLDEISKKFGETVAELVEGVTKLGHVRLRSEEEQQAKNLRKMMLAVSRDARVILIKLADRLHNMQTITAISPDKQKGIARETLEIYAPIAHRFGIQHLKNQLEDLSFAILYKEDYQMIENAIKKKYKNQEKYLMNLKKIIAEELKKSNIKVTISARSKNLYGIYRNVFIEGREQTLDQMLDIYGVRIIAVDIPSCYVVLGIIHKLFHPLAGRLKDYIANPKSNGYQSLHTGVIAEDGKIVEIQIRTCEMHDVAEFGLAAHWRYKEKDEKFDKNARRLGWISRLFEWQEDMEDKEFFKALKLDLYQDEIFVFTPQGEVRNLPSGATPVDFAFAVHSDLALYMIGAKVNQKLVPINQLLQNGDIVEIILSKKPVGVSDNWLDFVKTSAARSKIKKLLKKTEGKILNEKTDKKMFFEKIKEKIFPKRQAKKIVANRFSVRVAGQKDTLMRFAACCHPQAGTEKIGGYITRGRGVTVHNQNCAIFQNLVNTEQERIIDVSWEKQQVEFYKIPISIKVWDRVGLIKDITTVLSDCKINIFNLTSKRLDENRALIQIVLEINDFAALQFVMKKLEEIPDVQEVKRD